MSRICDADGALVLCDAPDHQCERSSQSSLHQQVETLHVVPSPFLASLCRMCEDVSATSAARSFRSRRRIREEEVRVFRALSLVHMVNCLQPGRALEGGLVAPGNFAALRALTNLERRSAVPRERLSHFRWTQISSWFICGSPGEELRQGPSGMHSDHHFQLLERPSLAQVARAVAVGGVL